MFEIPEILERLLSSWAGKRFSLKTPAWASIRQIRGFPPRARRGRRAAHGGGARRTGKADTIDVLCAPEARSRLRRWENLPPFHPVALRLMRAASSDDVPLTEVAAIVRSDGVFAAEILRLANSPLFGFRQEIESILHAVCLLGPERVRGLALTVALRRFLGGVLATEAARVCWRHNLACALLCEELSGAYFLSKDPSYTAGFLHDIGRLALLASFPAQYAQMLGLAALHRLDVRECEQGAFGLDHCVAGSWLVEEWQFPVEFREFTGRHHDPPDGHKFDMTTLVQLGCRTADALGFDVTGPGCHAGPVELRPRLPKSVSHRFGSDSDLMLAIAEKINALECSLLA